MTEPEPPTLTLADNGRYPSSQPTPEELAQIIYDAVLHCIQYKAQAIEAVEKLSKERASHD